MANEDKKKRLHEVAKRNFEYVPVDYEEFSKKASNPDFSRRLSQDLLELEKGGFIKKAPTYEVLISAFGATPAPTATTASPATTETNVVPGGGQQAQARTFPTPSELQRGISNQPLPNVGVPPVGDESGMPPSISGTPGQAPVGGQPSAQESAPQGGTGLGVGQFQITDTTGVQQAPVSTQPQMAQPTATATGTGGVPKGAVVPQELSFAESIGNAVQRGYNRGEIADYITAMGKEPTGDELKKIAELTAQNDKLATSEYMQKFASDPDLSSTLLALPEIAVESIASLYRHGLARMGAGAVAGGTAGLLGGPFAPITVPAGAGTGILAGMTVAGLGMEVSSVIMETLRELGVDTTNEEALRLAFSNPKIIDYAKTKAYQRAIPIAMIDALSMGVAGKFLGKPASSAVRRGFQVLGEAGVQGAFGSAGEATAQLVSGEEFKPYEVLAEGLAEIPGSVPEVAIAVMGKKKAQGGDTRADANRLVANNPDMPVEVISEMVDIGVGAGELTATQADEIKAEVKKAQEINARIPAEIKDTEFRVAAIGLIEERESLQAQLGSVDEAFKPAIEAKIKGINEQLQALSEVPAIEQTQSYFDTNQPTQTNPILTLPEVVDNVLNQIDEGILISSERLYEVSTAVNNAVRETLANKAMNPEERNATLNLLSGMLSDIDKANTEGQKFVEEVEAGSVQDRVPAVREEAVLPEGQRPSEAKAPVPTPSITKAREVKQKTNVLPSSGEVIVTPAPATTEVATEEVVTEMPITQQTQVTPTQDAVQKQTAGQVPVQSGTTSSQEVAKGEPKAEPKGTAKESQTQKEVANESKANQEKPLLEGVRDGGTEGKAGQEGTQLRTEETGTTQATTETEVKTTKGEPKTYEVFRGQDEDYEVGEYDGTYGKGVYYTGNKKSAKVYGKNVTSHKVELSNPFIIKGTRVQGVSLEGMKDYINENVIPKGHDGVIILDGDGNIFELVKFDTQKSKTDTQPTPEAKPKSAMEQAREARRQAQAKAKAKAPTQAQRVKAREAYFKPGAIVESYGGGRDKVIEYNQDPNDPTKWSVTVQQVDAQGNPVGEQRTHKTEPTDKEYKRAGIEVVGDADPNDVKKAKLEAIKARNKELDEEFKKSMGNLTANLNPKQVAIIAEKAWNKLQEIAINTDISATAVATRIKRAIDDAIAEFNAMVTATGNNALMPDKDDFANIVNAVRKLAYPQADMGKIGESDATTESPAQQGKAPEGATQGKAEVAPTETPKATATSGTQDARAQREAKRKAREEEQRKATEAPEGKPKAMTDYEARLEERRRAYKPGNIVPSYAGRDRVISYYENPNDPNDWSVTVELIDKDGKAIEEPRTHKTAIDKRDLKKFGFQTAEEIKKESVVPKDNKEWADKFSALVESQKQTAKEQAKDTPKDSDVNGIVLQSGLNWKNIRKAFALPFKALDIGNRPISIAYVKFEDAVSKLVARGMRNSNRYFSNSLNILQGFAKNIAKTSAQVKQTREAMGAVADAANTAINFYNNAISIVNGDATSLQRVHQVLDPEVYEDAIQNGNLQKVELADLTPEEMNLYNALRTALDMIHEWHFVNGFIKQKTYDKFKGKYIPRFWNEAGLTGQTESDLSEFARISKGINTEYIKKRKEIDDMGLDIIQDPVYATATRMAQMLRNQAFLDYAKALSNTDKVYDGPADMAPPSYIKLEGAKYGDLNGKWVSRDIAEDFDGYFLTNKFANMAYDLAKKWARIPLVRGIKESKTVYDITVFLGNMTNNITMAFVTGVDPVNLLSRVDEGIKAIKEKDADYRYLVQQGVLGTDIVSNEIGMYTSGAPTQQLANQSIKDGFLSSTAKIMDKAKEAYGGADDVAKIAAFKSLVNDYGLSREEAATRVYDGLQNYGRVGRYFDVASKTPIIGNPYVKFAGDLGIMTKNALAKRPLNTIAFYMLLQGVAQLASRLSDEDEELKEAREARTYIPKIAVPKALNELGIKDAPLTFMAGDTELNVARFISPYYIYDVGDHGYLGTLEEASKFAPIQIKESESGLPVPKIGDPVLGPIISLINDRNFMNQPILDPTKNKYYSGDLEGNPLAKTINAIEYLSHSWIPYFPKVSAVYSGIAGEEDYYGRKRDIKDALINVVIKTQKMTRKEVMENYGREITYKEKAIEGLEKERTTAYNNALEEIYNIEVDTDLTENQKAKKIEKIENDFYTREANSLEKIAKLWDQAYESEKYLIKAEGKKK